MRPYGKKIGRGLKGSRFLDNGCPCCGREHSNKSSTRQYSKIEIGKLLKDLSTDTIDIKNKDVKKFLSRKVST